jgi:hypothetical protein
MDFDLLARDIQGIMQMVKKIAPSSETPVLILVHH